MKWLLPLAVGVAALFMLKKKVDTVAVAPDMVAAVTGGVKILKTSTTSMRPVKEVSAPLKKAFIATMQKYAPAIEKKYGIPPLITLAQAALESDFGTSGLAMQGRNLYGIKPSKAWLAEKRPTITMQTEEQVGGKYVLINALFKKYDSWQASVEDWAILISGTYKTAYKYAKAGDVAAYGAAMIQFGYSTHPQYAKLLAETAVQIV